MLVLAVEHQLLGVLGRVELADLAEDAELAEHALHAERARLVGDDRDDVRAELLVAQRASTGSGRRPSSSRSRARPVPSSCALNAESSGTGSGGASVRRCGQRRRRAPRGARAGSSISGESSAGLWKDDVADLVVGEVELEAVAEGEQRLLVHLLLLVGDVLALAGLAHPVALDRLGEDHRRLALVADGLLRRRRRPSAGRGRRG